MIDEIAGGIIKFFFRIFIEIFFRLIFYFIGYLIVKLVTLGRYPRAVAKKDSEKNNDGEPYFYVSLVGLLAVILFFMFLLF